MAVTVPRSQPDAGEVDLLGVAAVGVGGIVEGFAGGGQARGEDVPAEHFGAGREVKAHAVAGHAATVGDGFERQPFEAAVVVDAGVQGLLGFFAGAAVEAGGAGW